MTYLNDLVSYFVDVLGYSVDELTEYTKGELLMMLTDEQLEELKEWSN